jgi:hypothetical protein
MANTKTHYTFAKDILSLQITIRLINQRLNKPHIINTTTTTTTTTMAKQHSNFAKNKPDIANLSSRHSSPLFPARFAPIALNRQRLFSVACAVVSVRNWIEI